MKGIESLAGLAFGCIDVAVAEDRADLLSAVDRALMQNLEEQKLKWKQREIAQAMDRRIQNQQRAPWMD